MSQGQGPMTITAAIATFNGAQFIDETLTAILSQSRPPDEVIVVDDGSTDTTLSCLGPFRDRIKLITIENSGPEAAKKTAIEAASSSWICLCDHDDIWHTHHLDRFEMLVKKYPETDFAFSNFKEFDTAAQHENKFESIGKAYWQGAEIDEDGFQFWGGDTFSKILAVNPFFPSAGIFRKSLYEKIGGIRDRFSYNPAADADMTRRFALAGNLACDHAVSVGVRKHSNNYSRSRIAGYLARIEILNDNLHEGGVFREYQQEIEVARSKTAEVAMWTAFYHRDTDAFKKAAAYLPLKHRGWGLKLRSFYMAILLCSFWIGPVDEKRKRHGRNSDP